MKCLERNKQKVWYQLYLSSSPVLSGEYETGELDNNYTSPTLWEVSVSSAYGSSVFEGYGQLTNRDLVLMTDDLNCPVKEGSVLFIETPPIYENNVLKNLHDYVVVGLSKSLNSLAYLARKV